MLLDYKFYYLIHSYFSSRFFLNAESPIFSDGFFEKPPELTKDPKWRSFANNQVEKV